MARWRRIALWAGVSVVTLALVALVGAVWTVRSAFPVYDGQLRLAGLSAPVTVYRDAQAIPQVYAHSADDLFTAQGYVHAQERFWEMDFRRHLTAGRLAELFGRAQVQTDRYLRTMGWRRGDSAYCIRATTRPPSPRSCWRRGRACSSSASGR